MVGIIYAACTVSPSIVQYDVKEERVNHGADRPGLSALSAHNEGVRPVLSMRVYGTSFAPLPPQPSLIPTMTEVARVSPTKKEGNLFSAATAYPSLYGIRALFCRVMAILKTGGVERRGSARYGPDG